MDVTAQTLEFAQNLIPLQRRQLAKLQTHHGVGLVISHAVLGESPQLALQRLETLTTQGALKHSGGDSHAGQTGLGLLAAGRGPADGDHLVERTDGDKLAFQHMTAFFRLAQQKLGATADHLHPMLQEAFDQLLDGQQTRTAIHQRQQDDRGGPLQRRILVELVENKVRVGIALDVEHQPHRFPGALTRLVTDGRNAANPLVFNQLAYIFSEAIAGLLVRHLGDNDLLLAPLLVDMGPGAQGDTATAGGVPLKDPLAATEDATRRIIRPGNHLHEAGDGRGRLIDQQDGGVAHFAQVVRRDLCGHTHSDAIRTVDQQVGEAGGKNQGLTVSLSRSSSIRAEIGVRRASVYRMAAGGRPAMEPKFPWLCTRRWRMFQSWAMRTSVG